jgi:TraX protein
MRLEPVTRAHALWTVPVLSPRAQDLLKLAAIISMVLDHIGALLLPDVSILRIIGRFAMPAFALLLGYNLAQRHVPPKRLIIPLITFGLLAQPVYALASATAHSNILFAFALGVLIVAVWRELEPQPVARIVIVTLLATVSLFTEYPLMATLLVVLSEHVMTRVTGFNLMAWMFCALAANVFHPSALVGLLPLLLLFALHRVGGSRLLTWRWFGYTFYPAHLGLLLLLRSWFAPHF